MKILHVHIIAHTQYIHRSLNKLPYMLNRQFGTYVEFAKNSNVKELCCFAKYNMPSVVDFYDTYAVFFVCRHMCLGRHETRLQIYACTALQAYRKICPSHCLNEFNCKCTRFAILVQSEIPFAHENETLNIYDSSRINI